MKNECIALAFAAGGSDKVYLAQLEAQGDGYVVNMQYGRRGGTLAFGTKTAGPVPYEKAKQVYDAVLREKMAKGYTPNGGAGTPFSGTEYAGRISGVEPQLSNEVSEAEAIALLGDPAWGLQQKADGERRPVRFGVDPAIGINKKGLTVALPSAIIAGLDAMQVGEGQTTLDAELVGDVLCVFDVIELRGTDLRKCSADARYALLASLPQNDAVRLLPMAKTSAEKRALFHRVQTEQLEGVVFKRLDATYEGSRPNSGGPSLKFKFYAYATVRVARINDGKRSVVTELHDGTGQWREVGSVTIPPSSDIPTPGTYIEVRYLYAMPGGSMIQPTFKGVRSDQDDADCLLSQLKLKPVAAA